MQIPEQVKIGPQTYQVVRNTDVAHRNNFGECDLVKLKIELDGSAPEARLKQTFMHEMVEAVNWEYDMKLKHHQIELLEIALYQLVLDNPEIFEVAA